MRDKSSLDERCGWDQPPFSLGPWLKLLALMAGLLALFCDWA